MKKHDEGNDERLYFADSLVLYYEPNPPYIRRASYNNSF